MQFVLIVRCGNCETGQVTCPKSKAGEGGRIQEAALEHVA